MRVAFAVAVLVALTACGNKEPRLLNTRSAKSGPDEFAILPPKPLQEPTDYSNLPPPTPGGVNATDPTPLQDAVAVLGGKPGRLTSAGLGSGEGALVSHASRFGVAPGIRSELAVADKEWRRTHNGRLLERLFNVNVYFKAYESMTLDQHRELERWRGTGIWTPSAPPEGLR